MISNHGFSIEKRDDEKFNMIHYNNNNIILNITNIGYY